jgi:2-hydroxy-6-oxonona-2,4-dienedioate hydrolase
MSDTRPANFSSVWADLKGVSFKQHYIDAAGIRTRCIESGDPSKPLVLALHGVGGHAEAYSRNFGHMPIISGSSPSTCSGTVGPTSPRSTTR